MTFKLISSILNCLTKVNFEDEIFLSVGEL